MSVEQIKTSIGGGNGAAIGCGSGDELRIGIRVPYLENDDGYENHSTSSRSSGVISMVQENILQPSRNSWK